MPVAANQYYDYIDTAKADETGIRVAANYLYYNPAHQAGLLSRPGNSAGPDVMTDEDQYLGVHEAHTGGNLDSPHVLCKEENVKQDEVSIEDATTTLQVQGDQNGESKVMMPKDMLEPNCDGSVGSKVAQENDDTEIHAPPLPNLGGASHALNNTEVEEKPMKLSLEIEGSRGKCSNEGEIN